jgi:hypothetical protein
MARKNKNAELVEALRAKPVKKRASKVKAKSAKGKPPAEIEMEAEPIEGLPDFTRRSRGKSYRAAMAKLQALCGTPPQPVKHAAGGFSFHLHTKKVKSFDLLRVHEQFLKLGAYVFTTDPRPPLDKIVILPTTDPYEVIATMATNGDNYNVSNDDVITWMRQLADEQPYVLTGISWDFLDGRFTTKIKDPRGLAQRMVDFCPDLDDAKSVAKHLRTRSPRLFFWWD